jgi:hypothetical protein
MRDIGEVRSARSKGDPAWLGGSESLGAFEMVAVAIHLVPAIRIPANPGA